jgi:pyridoxal phosphate enzyme (YggS family)
MMTSHIATTTFSQRRNNILAALDAASAAPPTLVAVTKRQSEAAIAEALGAGHRVFGENRVQEADAHWSARRGEFPDLELRLIGPLQTNKASDAVALFDVIETLDRAKLAKALRAAIDKMGGDAAPSVLIQVNTGEEPQKAGVLPSGLEALLASATDEYGLNVTGLMCIPPIDEPAGPHFALLSKLADRYGLAQRSMGMSGDYAVAAQFGSTHVRVGTALFGARET